MTSPVGYWNSINPLNIQDVFDAPAVGLANIRVEVGEIKLKAMMVKWMNGFINYFSTNGTMDAMQVAETINDIIEEYPHYSIYDLKLFFKLARRGHFGKTYGRIDGQVIMEWLSMYDHQRDIVAQTNSINKAYKLKGKEKEQKNMFYNEYLKWKENDT